MSAPEGAAQGLDARKAAIRGVLADLGALAEGAGMPFVARDVRETRLPKLDDERFTVVVLGEFNHGKSTFINALLGAPVLPTGITPTTAVLAHVTHGARAGATLVGEDGARKPIAVEALGDWLTVDGAAKRADQVNQLKKDGKGNGESTTFHHVELTQPAALLENQLTIVDTPGVNDINEQRAEITYGYLPRADAAVFLLDATQILTASERQFLEERILRSTRDRLLFVVAKTDLLDEAELAETLAFAKQAPGGHRPRAGDLPGFGQARAGGRSRGLGHGRLRRRAGRDRRAPAAPPAARSRARRRRPPVGLRPPEPGHSPPLAGAAAPRAGAADRPRARAAALRARRCSRRRPPRCAPRPPRSRRACARIWPISTPELRTAVAADIDAVDAADIRRYLSFFVQDTWKAWTEAEGERISAELEKLAETVIQVANENIREVLDCVAAELGPADTKVEIKVDTLRYDASIFALGALGTTVFLFVDGLVGGCSRWRRRSWRSCCAGRSPPR